MRIYLSLAILLLFSCSEQKPAPETTAPKEAYVVDSKLSPYQLTSDLYVNSVQASIYNPSSPSMYQYTVVVVRESEEWSDTVQFYLNEGDTIRKQFIFAESEVRFGKPASFSGKLIKLEDGK